MSEWKRKSKIGVERRENGEVGLLWNGKVEATVTESSRAIAVLESSEALRLVAPSGLEVVFRGDRKGMEGAAYFVHIIVENVRREAGKERLASISSQWMRDLLTPQTFSRVRKTLLASGIIYQGKNGYYRAASGQGECKSYGLTGAAWSEYTGLAKLDHDFRW